MKEKINLIHYLQIIFANYKYLSAYSRSFPSVLAQPYRMGFPMHCISILPLLKIGRLPSFAWHFGISWTFLLLLSCSFKLLFHIGFNCCCNLIYFLLVFLMYSKHPCWHFLLFKGNMQKAPERNSLVLLQLVQFPLKMSWCFSLGGILKSASNFTVLTFQCQL